MKLDPRLQRVIGWVREHRTWLSAGMTLLVLGIAGVALARILNDISMADIEASLKRDHHAADPAVGWAERALLCGADRL
jgi:hypothetical protein